MGGSSVRYAGGWKYGTADPLWGMRRRARAIIWFARYSIDMTASSSRTAPAGYGAAVEAFLAALGPSTPGGGDAAIQMSLEDGGDESTKTGTLKERDRQGHRSTQRRSIE